MKNFKNIYYHVETLVFGEAFNRALKPERIIIGKSDINKKMVEVTWLDLEEYLLNLKTSMDSKNYSRGQQTVDFVERVRDYYYLLLTQNCSES